MANLTAHNSIGVTLVARASYYDRNPTTIVNVFQDLNKAPASATTEYTYTVPTGRKFILGGGSIGYRRVTAATTPGVFWSAVRLAGTSSGLLLSQTNTVDKSSDESIGSGGTLSAG